MNEINSSVGVSNVRPQVPGQKGSSSSLGEASGEASDAKGRLSGLREQIGTARTGPEGIRLTAAQQAPNAAADTLRALVKDAEEGDPTGGEHARALALGYSPDEVNKWLSQGFSLSEINDGTAEAVEQDKSGRKPAVAENPSLDDGDTPAAFASLGADTLDPDDQLKSKKPEIAATGEKNLKKATAVATADSDASGSASIADA